MSGSRLMKIHSWTDVFQFCKRIFSLQVLRSLYITVFEIHQKCLILHLKKILGKKFVKLCLHTFWRYFFNISEHSILLWNETFWLIFKLCAYIEYLEKYGALKEWFGEKLCICGGRRIFLTLSFGYFYASKKRLWQRRAVRYERHFITFSFFYAIICFTFSLDLVQL